MALTYFSTDDSDKDSSAAIPAFPRPCAISRNTSSSRGVSRASGDSRSRTRRLTSASTTCGSTTEPPLVTSRSAASS
jgi:hypothetical protein